ncbi:hypothetical protein [Nodosilinea sp. P-1105]|uniref:hypothetical protein n=1 Tax=Nodosilinea sp. P-1105 TaxID=2546229 RepID=UPI00146EA14B|nr:hypothetical protein [Nodosilinea sp. P-1105]NMF84876.1 hypothetical protein [Nodosilinea sp. P-1105]
MAFDLYLLDNLGYEKAEIQLDDYINQVIQAFVESPEGQAYGEENPGFGRWTASFISYAYRYEGFTLTSMTRASVDLVMGELLPRKITLMDASEAADTVPELIAFWSFLQREYDLENAADILTYLDSIKTKFPQWMVDPARAGMAKSFMMGGMQAGFDMTTQEGATAYQMAYNAQLQAEREGNSPFSQLGEALQQLSSGGTTGLPAKKKSKPKKPPKTKGFGSGDDGGTASQKKKKKKKR